MLPQAAMPVPYPRSRVAGRLSRWLRPVQAWALRRSAAYVYQLDDLAAHGEGHDEPLGGEYSFRMACLDDLEACSAMAGVPLDEYLRRWNCGGRCYAVFYRERPVHLGWFRFGSLYVRGLGLLIEADLSTCYLHSVETDPEHRRRGLYKNTLRKVAVMLAARRIQRVTQVVMVSNRIPQIALPQLGYRLVQSVRHTSLLGIKATTVCDPEGKTLSRRLFCRSPKSVFVI